VQVDPDVRDPSARCRTGRARTVSLARSLYGHLPDGAPLWDGPQRIAPARPGEMLDLLGDL